jgi:hypothetical protein
VDQREFNPPSPEFPPDEAELARQLLALRHQPGSTLKRRVQAIPRQKPEQPASRYWVGGTVALLVVALLFVSPAVTASLDEVQQIIGQIHLTVRSVWPEPISTETVTPLEVELMTPAEARARLPFDFTLPAYVPEGLNRPGDRVAVAKLALPMAKVEWRDPDGGFVQLTAAASSRKNQLAYTVVGPDSQETIQINGQEAVLVRGGWDSESRTWSHQDRLMMLLWTVGDVQYRLLSFSEMVSFSELITMAESIRLDEDKP